MQVNKHNKLYKDKETKHEPKNFCLGKKGQELLAKVGLVHSASEAVSDKAKTMAQIEDQRIAAENAQISTNTKKKLKQSLAAGVALGGAVMTAQVAHADTTQGSSQNVTTDTALAASKARVQTFIDQANRFMASSAYQNATPADQALYQNTVAQAKADLASGSFNADYYNNVADTFQRVINQVERPSQIRFSHVASEEENTNATAITQQVQAGKAELQTLVNQADSFMASHAYQNATPADQSLYQTALSQAKTQLATDQADYTSALDNFQRVINQVEHPSHLVYSHTASEEEAPASEATTSQAATSEASATVASETETSSQAPTTTASQAQATTVLAANHEEAAPLQSDFGKLVTEAKATGNLTAVSQTMAEFINTPQGETATAAATPSASQAKPALATSQVSEKDSASQAKEHLSYASVGVTGAVMTAAVGAARLKQAKNNGSLSTTV
ncbi:hypothetical protein [Ligilactobacillus agilis]|uniref:hypothetical protein n=1 Tax=Ligilactobacillus agilis TaxID=1601 RepID=UPI002550C87B|nr:hypothetical protein [Ligilactobacillus agilis]MDK6809255.1 hypothetical protein [Ligilactobacillus agilis]